MPSHCAVAISRSRDGDALHTPPRALLEDFAAAAEAGQTVALLITKGPGAAVVYYFQDAQRAFEAHERLAKLNARPVVAYVSPADGAHQPIARLHATSATAGALRSIGRLARLVAGARASVSAPIPITPSPASPSQPREAMRGRRP